MWNSIDHGKTIGEVGSENGKIISDIEHSKGARLTIEQDTDIAPYAITSGVYGCFFHTTYLSTFEEADLELEKMKMEISAFFEKETTEEQDYQWIEDFVSKH